MRTRAQALTDCIAYGWSREECEAEIDDSMVDGVYCDGNILITADGKRCIPADVVKRVREARKESPLPAPVPVVAPAPTDGGERVVLALLALTGVAYVLYRIVR